MSVPSKPPSHLSAILGWGGLSVTLYILLFAYEKSILDLSARGKWYFVVPILIAFLFSFVHGQFTGVFWEGLGFTAKK
ncbi:MAG: hypothetical protein HQM03_00955 [Magnetococcales bacterium]|nr:hypothetical protein [Magnetococcales bacterium]